MEDFLYEMMYEVPVFAVLIGSFLFLKSTYRLLQAKKGFHLILSCGFVFLKRKKIKLVFRFSEIVDVHIIVGFHGYVAMKICSF